MKISSLKIIRLISICLFSASVSLFAGSAPDSTHSMSAKGFLTLTSAADSLIVFLDNHNIGKTPIYNALIDTGKHKLVVLNSKHTNWAAPDWQREFTISTDDTLVYNVQFIRFYYVNSLPYAAQVLYNGKLLGRTPLIVDMLPQPTDLLIIRKQGYLDFAIRPYEQSKRFFDVKLQIDKISGEEKAKFAVSMKHRHIRKKIFTYSAIGLSIVSGLGSIYLKKLSDRKYDEYLNAGDPIQMSRLYDETKHLDTYAGISYGIFQVSFVTSIYLFLAGRK